MDIIDSITPEWRKRYDAVKQYGKTVRVSEYHVTNACNIRCKGCWFFENEFEKKTKENKDIQNLRSFVQKEVNRGINTALLIGGEPTMFLDRIRVYCDHMRHVSISTNGLTKLPYDGFEDVNVFVSLFGGGRLDDELRAIKPNGKKFSGLFDTILQHYTQDPRVCFVYAVTEDGIDFIEDTVRKIHENENRVTFNFYSKYDQASPLQQLYTEELVRELMRVKNLYPNTVLSTPYYIKSIISGNSHWGSFNYENCPSISVDHKDNQARIKNGSRILPLFNTYAPDLKTLNLCCTSGNCADCRDSQAVFSWLLVSEHMFRDTIDHLQEWVEIAESFWKQFVWSPYVQFPNKIAIRSDELRTTNVL